LVSDLSGYVPYTGATGTADLTGASVLVADAILPTQAVNLQTLQSAVGTELKWYLSNTASADVAGYKLLADENDAGQTAITVDGTASGQTLDEWVTVVGEPGELSITESEISAHFYAKVARVNANDFLYQIQVQFFKRTGAVETQLGLDAPTIRTLDANSILYTVHAHLDEPVTLVAGDRIVAKLTTIRTGSAPRVTAQVVTLYLGSTTPSHITLPTTLAILGKYVQKTGDTMTGLLTMSNAYVNFSNGYGMFTGANNFLLYSTYFEMNKKLINDDTNPSTFAGDIRGEDFVNRRDKTITRNAAGFITSVAMTGGRTVTMTRDASNFITSKTDATNTWSYTRDASNLITAIAVT
jgi:YD repeat-containing protein